MPKTKIMVTKAENIALKSSPGGNKRFQNFHMRVIFTLLLRNLQLPVNTPLCGEDTAVDFIIKLPSSKPII